MSLRELESAVTRLPQPELTAFARWFEEFMADAWDRQIESDIVNGKLDAIGKKVDEAFEAGQCKPL